MKTLDPCKRPFFVTGVNLLPNWCHVDLWKPSDKSAFTPSDIFPWDIAVTEEGFSTPKFTTEMIIGTKCIFVRFFGVN